MGKVEGVEMEEDIQNCVECNKPHDKDKLELCPDGEWRCFPCMAYEVNFGDEEKV